MHTRRAAYVDAVRFSSNIQSSSLHHGGAPGAGQHVDKLLLHIISLFFPPKSNNSVVIILLFRQPRGIAAKDRLREFKVK